MDKLMEAYKSISEEILLVIQATVDATVQESAKAIQLRLSEEQEKYILDSLVQISLGRLVQIGTEVGTQAALDRIKREKKERMTQRFSRRLRNTKLLLREYRKLKAFSENCVYKKPKESAVQILDEIDNFEYEDELFVDAIKKSKERTVIIVSHIDRMLDVYKTICEQGTKDEHKRKYHVLKHYYLVPEEEKKTVDDLTKELFVGRQTIYNDIDDAARYLTSLVFGVDGLKL